MKSISLKLGEQILSETELILVDLKTSRNKYINDAIDFYNQYQKRKLIEKQIATESKLVSEDSLAILHEFESLQDEL